MIWRECTTKKTVIALALMNQISNVTGNATILKGDGHHISLAWSGPGLKSHLPISRRFNMLDSVGEIIEKG